MIVAAFSFAIAQTCATFLPPAHVPVEWFRNGQSYARDLPVSSTASERVYRRTFPNGNTADVTRVLTCTTSQRGPVLRERVGASEVSIPVQLRRAQNATVNGSTVRRIDPPDDAVVGTLWFSVSRYGPQLYGLRERIGIEEVRTPSVSGRVDIMRAVLTPVEPAGPTPSGANSPAVEAVVRMLNARLAEQERLNRDLRDSLAAQRRAADSVRRDSALIEIPMAPPIRVPNTPEAIPRAARLIADSAARLPSEETARAWGWVWPGAGHGLLDRSGVGWTTIGIVSASAAIAGAVLPESTLDQLGDPAKVRAAAIAGGAGAYLLSLLISHSRLERAIRADRAGYRTRESFLRAATIDVTPAGELVITIKR